MAGTLVVDKIQLDIGNTFQIVSNTGGLILSANNAGLQTGIAANSITYGMISPSILATQNNVYNVVSANANTGVGNSTVTFTSNTGAISAGMIVYGAGFGRGTTVSSVVNANTILLSTAAANTSTNTRLSFVEPNKLVTAEIVGPGLCKAWVNFNGTGTVAIRAAFNVSSITDNGTGQYTVNFTTAMQDTSYATIASGYTSSAGLPAFTNATRAIIGFSNTSSSCRIQVYRSDLNSFDSDSIELNVAVFR
jgi:hypothetical protein